MRPAIELAVIAGCYLLGCLSPGYWLVRRRTGDDVRRRHSGRTGARNVGRVMGTAGFAITFALDATKGALAVLLARAVGLGEWTLAAAALAVVVGHVWPVQLGFRGGRGLSTALGVVLVLQPPVALGALAAGGLVLVATRQVDPAGMAAVVAAPLVAWLTGAAAATVATVAALAGLALYTHRGMLRAIVARFSHAGDAAAAGRGDRTGRAGAGEAPGAAASKGPPR